MFVVLTKSDCDIKYIIFKVKKKNQRVRPCPLLSPSFLLTHTYPPSPRLGSPVWEIPRIICLLICAPETGTHTQGGSGGTPGAAGLVSPAASFARLRQPALPGPHTGCPSLPPSPAGLGPLLGVPGNVEIPSTGFVVSGPRSAQGGPEVCQDSGSAQDPPRDPGDRELRGLATACETPALRDDRRSRTRCALQPGPRAARGEWASAPRTFQAQPTPRRL